MSGLRIPTGSACEAISAICCSIVLPFLMIFALACTEEQAEQRAREVAEKIQKSIPDVDAVALSQQVDPDVLKEVQRQLTTLNEYQGEVTGELDLVTVNAIQAFQRSAAAREPVWWPPWWHLKDDGILNQRTRELLAEAAHPPETAPN